MRNIKNKLMPILLSIAMLVSCTNGSATKPEARIDNFESNTANENMSQEHSIDSTSNEASLFSYENNLDEELNEEDLPDNVSKTIAKRAYSLIILDFMAHGYEVYYAYLGIGIGYGFAYTDFTDSYLDQYTEIDSEDDEVDYAGAGFISLNVNKPKKDIQFEPTYMIITTYDSNKSESLRSLIDNRRVEGINGHFVADNLYVKYSLIGDAVYIYTYEKNNSNYDTSLGSIYDYDKDDYLYIPLDQIPEENDGYEYLVHTLDRTNIKSTFDNMIQKQEEYGYEKMETTTIYISTKLFETLNGTLSQKASVNNYLISTINNLEYDPNTQYLTMREDGTIGINEIPVAKQGKTLSDWIADTIIIGGGLLIGVVLTVCTGGTGTVIAGAIFGAVGEYSTEALLLGKRYDEVNLAKIGLSAITGALTAGIPVAQSGGQFAATLCGIGVLEASKSVAFSMIDNVTDTETIVRAAAGQALLGMSLYTMRNVVSVIKNVDVSSVKTNTVTPDSLGQSRYVAGADTEQALVKIRQTFEKQSINNVVGGAGYSFTGGSEIAGEYIETASKVGISKAIDAVIGWLFE